MITKSNEKKFKRAMTAYFVVLLLMVIGLSIAAPMKPEVYGFDGAWVLPDVGFLVVGYVFAFVFNQFVLYHVVVKTANPRTCAKIGTVLFVCSVVVFFVYSPIVMLFLIQAMGFIRYAKDGFVLVKK